MFTTWNSKRTTADATGDERAVATSLLEFHRETLFAKCEGISEEQLKKRAIPPSAMSLLGLLRHMIQVEMLWTQECLEGRNPEYPFKNPEVPDSEFEALDSMPVEEVFFRYLAAVEISRTSLASYDFDELKFARIFHREVSVRFIHIHLLEEYARHCGHADLLREAVDGRTGY